MLIDARQLPSGTTLEAAICIVGAGPAGLTLARRLRGLGAKIVLVEKGGEPGPPLGVASSATAVTDESDFDPPPSVPARFGGGANEWIVRLQWMARGVRMLPLQPIDLDRRDWVACSGWPMSWEQLEPYLRRAHDELGLGPWGYAAEDWADARNPELDLERAGFISNMERFARPSVFTRDAWAELREAPDVDVVLHAPVGAIEGSTDRVDSIAIDERHSGRLAVRASCFVLACGGVVNPALLLGARDGSGIGAGGPAVGAYFMDHFRFISGTLIPFDPARLDQLGLYDIRSTPRGVAMGKLGPSAALQREHGLLNSAAMLLPRPAPDLAESLGAIRSAVGKLRSHQRPDPWPAPTDIARTLGFLVTTVPEMAIRQRRFPPRTDAGWASMSRNGKRYGSLMVEHQIEQAPDARNRLALNGRRDRHGRLEPELTWQWGELDLRSARDTVRLFGDAMANAGIGDFRAAAWSEHPELTTPGGAFHPSGGTRMSHSARDGATDADCKVHGVSNLYVAGSSLFPTAGYANPTLTLIALAIRLGDRLAGELTAHPVIDA